ncbi:hypothetical protein IPC971_27560 [Pseudomonas aeruginosa]|nr:hypothetical protein IPC971_27560 [Pseudomonas aeruginosa]
MLEKWAGTQCYEYNTGHKHNGMDSHYHIWQMNKSPNGCFWNKKRGLADTHLVQPSGLSSCSSY